MVKSYFTLLILLVLSHADVSFDAKDGPLDPGPITMWKEKWAAAPITLSLTNVGKTATITFNFRPYTTVSGAYVEVTYPSNFASGLTVHKTMDLKAEMDTSIDFVVTLPGTVSIYGPFSIVTRASASGQMIDSNPLFGWVSTTEAAYGTSSTGLTVALDSVLAGTSTPTIGESGLDLIFSFTIDQSLWKHDLIEIIPDDDWTSSKTTICKSETVNEDTENLFIGPNNDHVLPCGSTDDSTSIFVYGISEDVFVETSLIVNIRVSSFTAPGIKYSRSAMNGWQIKIWRFGTETLLAEYGSTTGPCELATGTISGVKWAPSTSSIIASEVVVGMTLYVDVTFTTSHDIPISGMAIITFVNVNLDDAYYIQEIDGTTTVAVANYCYIDSATYGATCSVGASTLNIIFTKAAKAGTYIATILATFSASPRISGIVTKTTSLTEIDATATATTWTLGSSNKLENFKFFKYNSIDHYDADDSDTDFFTPGQQNGGDGGGYLWFLLDPATGRDWTTNTKAVIYLDFVTTGIALEQVYISETATILDGIFTDVNLNNADPVQRRISTTDLAGTYDWVNNIGQIKVSLTSPVDSGSIYIFAFSDATKTALPLAASNKATKYELVAKLTTTVSNTASIDIGIAQFTVFARNSDSSIPIHLRPLCQSNLAGIPMVFSFEAYKVDIDFGSGLYNFAVDVVVSGETNFGTGLTTGDNYPFYSSDAPNAAVKLTGNGKLKITGLGSLEIGEDVEIYIPKGVLVATDSKLKTKRTLYYTYKSGDTETVYVLLEIDDQTGHTIGAFVDFDEGPSSSSKFVVGDSSDLVVSIKDADATGTIIGIGLPEGFYVPGDSVAIRMGGSSSPTNQYKVSSTDSSFIGNFIMGDVIDGGFDLSGAEQTLTVSGVQPTSSKLTSGLSDLAFVAFVVGSVNAACRAAESFTISNSLSTGDLTGVSFDPSLDILARGPDNLLLDVDISFTTAHIIPLGGDIKIGLATDWVWADDCSATSGLEASDSAIGIICSVVTNVLTVSGFKAVSATTPIIIKASNTVPPTSPNTYNHVTYIRTRDADEKIIDEALSADINLKAVVIANSATAGTSTISSADIWPINANTLDADVAIRFKFSYDIPAGSIITIDSGSLSWNFSEDQDLQDDAFTTFLYSLCTLNNGDIEITTAELIEKTVVQEIFISKAFDLGSAGKIQTFKFTVKYLGITIISDTTAYEATVTAAVLANSLYDVEISVNYLNAGELADYNFTLTSKSNFTTDDLIVIRFDKARYGPQIGNSIERRAECNPGVFYIPCESNDFSNPVCFADHWYATAARLGDLEPDTPTHIVIKDVRNPSAGKAGAFSIYHIDTNSILKAFVHIDQDSSPVITAVPETLTFKSVESATSAIGTATTLTFDFYLDEDTQVTDDFSVLIYFPQQYNLLLSGKTTVTCFSSYYDESGDENSNKDVELEWATEIEACTAGEQWVSLESPSDFAFKTDHRIRVNLTEVPNPQFGLERDDDSDKDTENPDVFGEFAAWTEKFTIFLKDSSTNNVISKSYGILNSGYLGIENEAEDVNVGNYDAAGKSGRIKLIKGTQSEDLEIRISAWLKSKSVTLKPASNPNYPDLGKLTYTSNSNWTIKQGEVHMNFKVAAASDTATGLYYINWALTEEKQEGVTENLYSAPVSALVEVCYAGYETIVMNVDSIPAINRGYTSIPIRVYIAKAPNTDLTLGLSLGTSTGIKVNPSSLKFTLDVNDQYFEITVDSAYDTTQATPSLTFILTGTDAETYQAPTPKTITVTSNVPSSTLPTINIGTLTVKDNKGSITVTSSQTGVLYWVLSCLGYPVPTFKEVLAKTPDLVSPDNSTLTLEAQLRANRLAKETDPSDEKDADVYGFFRRQYGDHCASVWANSTVVYANKALTLNLDWLFVGTKYVLYAFVNNKLTTDTTSLVPATTTFTYSSLPSVYTHKVAFAGSVAAAFGDSIKQSLAKSLGINPAWLADQTFSSDGLRMLADDETVVTHYILFDRSITGLTPKTIVDASDESEIKAGLKEVTGVDVKIDSVAATASSATPSWSAVPTVSSVSDSTSSFTAASSEDGLICTVCADPDLTGIQYAWQVLAGVDSATNLASSVCVDVIAAKPASLTVTGLKEDTAYNCWFTACGNYPLWPNCIEATESILLAKISIVTVMTEEESSSVILSLFGALFLIFN